MCSTPALSSRRISTSGGTRTFAWAETGLTPLENRDPSSAGWSTASLPAVSTWKT